MTKLSRETTGVQLLATGAFMLLGIAFLGVAAFIGLGGHVGASALYVFILAALVSTPLIAFGLFIRLRRIRDRIGTGWVDFSLVSLTTLVVGTVFLFITID